MPRGKITGRLIITIKYAVEAGGLRYDAASSAVSVFLIQRIRKMALSTAYRNTYGAIREWNSLFLGTQSRSWNLVSGVL